MKFFKKFNNRGFMVVEILVALSIIILLILSATSVVQKSLEVSRLSLNNAKANFLLEEGAEMIRSLRDVSWDAFVENFKVGKYYYPTFMIKEGKYIWYFEEIEGNDPFCVECSEFLVDDIFSRRVALQDVYRDGVTGNIVNTGGTLDLNTKLVTVYVYWKEKTIDVDYKSKSISFYLTNIFD